jgi:hypothetical protein
MISNLSKSIKCKSCREKFVKPTPWAVVCSPECAEKLVKTKKEKVDRKETKARKEALKTRSDYMKDAQKAFNAYIRARDADKPCISCGVPLKHESLGGGYDCGHYRSVGSAPHLRFHPDNAHGQCKKCNRYLSGNAVEYRQGLKSRIGETFLDLLERDQCVRKYTIEGLQALASDYKRMKSLLLN